MKYAIGIDYGTESGRVILVNIENGDIVATSVTPYPHGVITGHLNNRTLGKETALQVPQDYLEVLINSIPEVMKEINPNDIVGIGLDFTSSTILPVDENLNPLCETKEHENNPHAYVKLWKHHEAEDEAKHLNKIVQQEQWTKRYGGTISSEWMLPKVLEIANDDPPLFNQVHLFLEAGDWVISKLTGNLIRNSCSAGYKGTWHKETGFIDNETLQKISPALNDIYKTKLQGNVQSSGTLAGTLTKEISVKVGLHEGTPVAVGIIDAHAALPGAGVSEPGTLVMVMGTSTCHLLLSDKEVLVPGISGVVEGGILPGYFAYEAGQAAVGDLFAHFLKNYQTNFETLSDEAKILHPGQSGLLALDWHNGCRTPFVDTTLSGVLVGEKLSTTPAEVYRALLEATAFGTKVIIDLFEKHEIPINQVIATGGIPNKNNLLMQIYADILQKEITVVQNDQAPALGAAILGAVAAGAYDSYSRAIRHMASNKTIVYKPNKDNANIYIQLFDMYKQLSTFFTEQSSIMHDLNHLKGEKKYDRKPMEHLQ
ncbi:ribulokinase [Psychrobacillus psychrodurans]|uniref:Ribulokinase n=1 Tax=Psychrobacillus psychrodurans TaxID=126157 RepID=A0A9X3L6I7_9BACI|nr:ribulokinase [Psychrobacillus psychrodurans]MCZ8532030.1 ribulokinase [Psychrobacillus psychrodurans]